MYRNFTEQARRQLKEYINDVTPQGFFETLADRISDFFKNFSETDVNNYTGQFEGYQKRVLDVKNIGKKNVDKLFEKEWGVEKGYTDWLSGACNEYDATIIEKMRTTLDLLAANGAGFDFSADKMQRVYAAGEAVNRAAANIATAKGQIKTQNDTVAKLKKEKQGKRGEYNLFSADPVNLATGNFIYEKTDITLEGEIPLSFRRFYNAQDKTGGVLGQGYRHNHEMELREEEGGVEVIMDDGNSRFFARTEGGGYEGILATRDIMEVLMEEDGENSYVMTTPDGEKYYFNARGRLSCREDLNGRQIRYTYNGVDQLVRAESDRGDFLTFSYHETGLLASVTTSQDRDVCYVYEGGRLDHVVMANGNRYYYRYTQNGEMQEIKNAREVITVKNTYDDQCRITRQEFPDGTEMLYEYQGNELILTERNGSRITYVHDDKLRNTDVKYEDGTTEHFEYNEKSQKTLVRDRNGNTTRFSYDNRGNVVKVINALGQISTMTYDANNRLLTMKVNRKNRIKNTYDANGNLLTSVGTDGNGMLYAYDEKGRVIRAEDADHDVTELTYDARGNIIAVSVNGVGNVTYQYDSHNNVVASVDGNGNETTYRYDEDNRLIGVKNPLGDEAAYEYSVSGKVTKVRDFDGYEIRATYNDLNKEETIADKEGNITGFSYDAMWNVASVKRADGGVIQYSYDKNNRLEEVVAPEGNTIKYTYDGNGNLLTETDGNGAVVRYTYDALNRRKSMTDPLGNETTYMYDGSGNLVKETDAMGNETTYTYDDSGRLIDETDVLGNTTSYVYTAGGKRKEVRYANGTCDTYKYENGQVIETARGSGERYLYAYDGNGNLILQKNALGEEVAFSYDAMNRMTAITLPTGDVRRFAYNAVGKLTDIVDENGNETHYTYSPNGNLIEVVDAMGGIARYDYDVMGNLIKVTRSGQDAEDEVTRYEWNKNDQIRKMIDPLGSEESYVYDMAGRMIEKQDREGYVTKVSYDETGNVTGLKYADEKEVLFSYDALSHLKEMRDWNGVTSIVSDAMGRALSVTDDQGQIVKYEWNSVGQKTKMIYPDGSEAVYSYNDKGLLHSLATADGQTKYAYDTMGRIVEKILPNGILTQYQYNNIGRLKELRHTGKDFEESYQFAYDAVGNKISAIRQRNGVEEDSGTYGYDYDALNQLISVTKDGKIQREYGYDAFGNRTFKKDYTEEVLETVYKYNKNNQLIADVTGQTNRSYQYDKRGNLLEVSGSDGILKQFSFDARNALDEAVERDGQKEKKAIYQYNGLGNRIGQTLGETMDPERQIRYTIDLTRQYHNMLSETVETRDGLETSQYFYDFNVVGMKKAVGAEYFIQDDLGSAMGVYDAAGELKEAYAYDEFGNEYGNVIDARERFQPLGYTGYQHEAVGNVYFAQARRYDARNGRFVSEDIVRGATIVPISMNHYAYVMNKPEDYIDADGRFVITATVALIATGAAIGAVAGATTNAISQGVRIYKQGGTIKDFEIGECVASGIEGAIVGGVSSIPGVGLVGTIAAGAIGAGTKSVIKQATTNNSVDLKKIEPTKVLEDTVVGGVSAGVFYGIGQGIKYLKGDAKTATKDLYKVASDKVVAKKTYIQGAIDATGRVSPHRLRQLNQLELEQRNLLYKFTQETIKKKSKDIVKNAIYNVVGIKTVKTVFKESLGIVLPFYKDDDTLKQYYEKLIGAANHECIE